jgi:hypothetical protein
MKCKKCKEDITEGDPVRAEPVEPGSRHHNVYHYACYNAVKEERQRRSLEDQASAARSVC